MENKKRKIIQEIKKKYLRKKVFQRWTLCSKRIKTHSKIDHWIVMKTTKNTMINYYFKTPEFKVCKQKKIVKIKDTYIIWISSFRSMIM